MKIKSIIIGLAISLMSTRCPDKPVYIIFENKSSKDILLSSTKDVDSLKKIILKNFSDDFRFKYLKNNSTRKDTLGESDLYYYYLPKDKNYYTFYFLKVVKFDTIKNNYIFEKRYDSINVNKEKILIGDEGKNVFTYGNKWVVFKAKENN